MRGTTLALVIASLASGLAAEGRAQGGGLLEVSALDDRPGPVGIEVSGLDADGNRVLNSVMKWSRADNRFSTRSLAAPRGIRVLRLTFVNDRYGGPDNPDGDRNAFIDHFRLHGRRFEAENFDRTGGPDPAYPGCAATGHRGRFVADCGNQGDFVEFDLSPRGRP